MVKENSINEVQFAFIMPQISTGNYIVEAAVCNGVMDNYQTYTWLYNVENVDILNNNEQYALLGVDTHVTYITCKKE